MSFSPIDKIESTAPVRDESSWVDQYKEAFVEHQHDTSQLTLILPDDCLVVVGPPRLSHASSENSFYPVGFLNSINISETRNVQPMKAIGSRRHIFAATNAPVQGSIGRLLFLGRNMLNALYANADFGPGITDRNSKYNGLGHLRRRHLERQPGRRHLPRAVRHGHRVQRARHPR